MAHPLTNFTDCTTDELTTADSVRLNTYTVVPA